MQNMYAYLVHCALDPSENCPATQFTHTSLLAAATATLDLPAPQLAVD
jgi:hypothetical protein